MMCAQPRSSGALEPTRSKDRNQVLLLVGRGSIGQKHEQNAKGRGVAVVTVDPDPKQGADCGDVKEAFVKFGKGYFTHALIATPVTNHLPTLLEVLDHGIPSVLLEKPLVMPGELEHVVPLVSDDTAQRVFLGFNWRFNSTVQRLKQEISRGDIGSVHVAHLSAKEWLPRYQGNVVLESGSHILDTARYLFGDLTLVGVHVSNHRKISDSDEAATFLLVTREGGHISVHVNFINPGSYDYTIVAQGDTGVLYGQPDRFEPMHRVLLEAFFRQDTSVLATLEDGVRNMELLRGVVEEGWPSRVRAN